MTSTARLGSHTVRRIGFGAMQLAGPGVFGPPRDPDAARAVLRRAVELGVDHIDTSQFYGPDVVNELIRDALYPYPAGLRIVSKVGARRDDRGAWLPAQTPADLRAGVEENLATLHVDTLAAVNLRLLDEGADVPLAEQLGTMEDLRREGKIEGIGLSNATIDQLDEAIGLIDLVCVQNPFSVMQRDGEDVLEWCTSRGIAFVPFFPLGSAFTGGPAALAADPAIAAVAQKHAVTATQVALAWLLHRDDGMLLIPGTSSVEHLEENLAAGDVTLDADDLTALDGAQQKGDPLTAAADRD